VYFTVLNVSIDPPYVEVYWDVYAVMDRAPTEGCFLPL